MPVSKLSPLILPATFDAHVHLRDDDMLRAVVPTIRRGGCDMVMVMPNLTPPLTTPASALSYVSRLQAADPSITYLPSLYLHSSMTPTLIYEAKAAGIVGIKSYPAGVTTNSSSGVISYESFYPIFAAMEVCGLILNLHGECPSSHIHSSSPSITVLNAEAAFLPTLHKLHARFPALKIILEHCTTTAAVAAVRACGPEVIGTLTAHHLYLTVDDWVADPFAFCKPVAKLPEDRAELLRAVVRSGGKFIFGSDSAPHDVSAKVGAKGGKTAAGVFTQAYASQLVVGALEQAVEWGIIGEEEVTREGLEGFLGGWGRKFYGVEGSEEKILLEKKEEVVRDMITGDGVQVVPFRRGKACWSLTWVK